MAVPKKVAHFSETEQLANHFSIPKTLCSGVKAISFKIKKKTKRVKVEIVLFIKMMSHLV